MSKILSVVPIVLSAMGLSTFAVAMPIHTATVAAGAPTIVYHPCPKGTIRVVGPNGRVSCVKPH
jgi:hypothetical protein